MAFDFGTVSLCGMCTGLIEKQNFNIQVKMYKGCLAFLHGPCKLQSEVFFILFVHCSIGKHLSFRYEFDEFI